MILGTKKSSGTLREKKQVTNKDKFQTSGSDVANVNFDSLWNTQYLGPRVSDLINPICLSYWYKSPPAALFYYDNFHSSHMWLMT